MALMARLPKQPKHPVFRMKGKGGVPLDTRLAVIITNGPQFIAALQAMDLKLSRIVARVAVRASGEVIAEKWRENARSLNSTGRGEGNYANSIQVTTRSSTAAGGEDGVRVLRGASCSISPTLKQPVPEDEQPSRYAAVLEFGGTLGEAQHFSHIPATGIARQAFESSLDPAVDACIGVLATALL